MMLWQPLLPGAAQVQAGGGGFKAAWAFGSNQFLNNGANMKKNVAGQKIGGHMITAADGTAFTGSVTVYVTGDAGTQAVGSVGAGACVSEGNGYYTYAPAQAETNYDLIAFTFTGTGAIPATVQVNTDFPQTGDSFARLGAPVGASISADITTIDDFLDTEIAAIKTKTDFLPSATAGAAGGVFIAGTNAATVITGSLTTTFTGNLSGSVGSVVADVNSNLIKISGSTGILDKFSSAVNVMLSGTAQTGTLSTTQMTTDVASTPTDLFKGRTILFLTGANTYVSVAITAYNGAGLFTFGAIPTGVAPSNGDTFIIV